MIGRAMRATGRHMLKSTSVSGEIYGMEHVDGSQSDTALGSGIKKRRSSLSQRVVAILPSRRSRSTSQLSQTGQRNGNTSRSHLTLGLSRNVARCVLNHFKNVTIQGESRPL